MPVEYAFIDISPKVPVSMRLPEQVVEQVAVYAQKNHVHKTDAYLHFLKLGLKAEAEAQSPATDQKLDAIYALLQELQQEIQASQNS